jgi:hypothetical protein|tara:strand:+ start:871 stop:1512 length:642 start_codon:yes stop_codon:yes gene_type:complete
MNYYFTGVLIVLFCLLALFVKPAYSGSTQSNTSGSNTAIEGGYTGGSTTYESGSTSSTTSTNSSTSNIKSAPPTANSPSFSAQSQDVCATGASAGVQTFGLGISGGKTFRDMNCERIKLAKVLYDFGMKVGSVALLCQDERVFEAMINAGTPCPIDGLIGKKAMEQWQKYDFERPDYKTYVKRMKKRDKIDQSIQIIELKTIETQPIHNDKKN